MDDREVEQRLIRAGEEWRATAPRLASPYTDFRRRVASTGRWRHASSVASAALVTVVAAVLVVVLSQQMASPPPVTQPSNVTVGSATHRHIPSPSAVLPVTPKTTNLPTNAASNAPPSAAVSAWTPVGGATTRPLWSPDGKYVLMRLARNGYGLVLYTADGQQVASYGGGEPAWLGDDKFVAYKHPAQASITSHTDIEAILGDARDGSVTDTTFPCCNPIGNGSGAAVVFWFPPHPGSSLERPQFSVWSDGNSTDPLPGFPFEWTAWSPAGDKLIIQHPFGSNPPPGPEGWVEVLAWPGLNSIYEGDHNKSTGSVAFDPSGAYLAYQNPLEPAQPNHVNDVDIATLATRAVSAIPIQGDQFSFAWNANSQLIVSDVVAGTLATYATDGTRVDSQVLDQATAYGTKVTSSTDGSTVLLERFDRSTYDNDRLTVERDGRTTILPALPSDSSNLVAYLSPNGDRLIVTTAGGAWLIKVA